ncbi:MAG: antibiotic biosynthesis monooxygenase family protein [bacterium]
MYIAMNRFRIAKGREDVFEDMWRNRESYLQDVPGFQQFHLLRGLADDESLLYASHTVWESQEAFDNWTNSEAFQKAHARGRAPEGTILGPPNFEGFEVVL